MPVTTAQLTDFCNFAIAHATQGDMSSVSQLATRWEAEREFEETVEEVRRSEREIAEGKFSSWPEALARIRQQLREQQQLEPRS